MTPTQTADVRLGGRTSAGTPRWEAVDSPTADLLSVLADSHPIVGADAREAFLGVCESDARMHGGLVSVNRVRDRMSDLGIEHHAYSAMWSHFTGKNRPMVKAKDDAGQQLWEVCQGSSSGNNGRPYPVRRWVA